MKMKKIISIIVIVTVGYIKVLNAAKDSDSFVKPNPDDPWYNLPLPQEPKPGHFRFLGGCIDEITKPYIKLIFNSIFKKELVDDIKLCQKLIKANYKCTASLADILGKFDKFKNSSSFIIQQTNNIYHHCEHIIN